MNTPRSSFLVSPMSALRRLLSMHRATAGRHIVLDVADRQIQRAEQDQQRCRVMADTARRADDAGIALIEKVTADGKITPEEMPDVQTALRNLRRSRDLDQQLSENPA